MTLEFALQTESIELYKLLKLMGLCESGGVAKHLISEGKIVVDGAVETRKRAKIKKGQVVRFGEESVRIS